MGNFEDQYEEALMNCHFPDLDDEHELREWFIDVDCKDVNNNCDNPRVAHEDSAEEVEDYEALGANGSGTGLDIKFTCTSGNVYHIGYDNLNMEDEKEEDSDEDSTYDRDIERAGKYGF